MKNKKLMMLALVGITAGLTVNAQEAAAAPVVQKTQEAVAPATAQKASEVAAVKLSADEQAFTAKLNDQNRKAFITKFSAEQRKIAMASAANKGATAAAVTPDEAVSKVMKDSGIIHSEKNVAVTENNAAQPASQQTAPKAK